MTEPTLPDFDAWWNYEDVAGTGAKFRALLAQAIASRDPTYHAELLTQIARTEGLQGSFDDAHRTLSQAESLLSTGQPRARIRYLLERGRVFNSSGNPGAARQLFLEAWDAARTAGEDFYAVDAAHMLGIVEPPDEQLGWSLKALDLAEQSSQERARQWLGALYNNIGWTYHELGQHEQALDLFQRALRFRELIGQPRPTQIARWTLAAELRNLARLDEAFAMQQALLDDLNAAGITDGYVYEEIGECLLALGRNGEAAFYFAQAYQSLSQDEWLVQHEADRLQRLKMLGGSA